MFLADVIYSPPILDRNLSIGIEAGFYFDKMENPALDADENVTTTVWTIPVLARITYQIPFEPFAVYFGVGGGLIINYTNQQAVSAGTEESGDQTGSVSGVLGMDYILGPGRVVLEFEYLPRKFGPLNGDGSFGGLFVTLGYRFDLLYK